MRFSGVAAGEACTIVVRGANDELLEEVERSIHDALCVLASAVNEKKITLGGGCAEMLMAKAVDDVAGRTTGKKTIAVEAFARALRQLPTYIADNGGYDSAQLVADLKAAHNQGKKTYGLDMDIGAIGCMREKGIVESLKLKRSVLLSASEAAEMILRVDNIIRSAPR